MGLNTVELVMNIEDTFSIDIPDADAEKLTTVGETYDYILKRFEIAKRGGAEKFGEFIPQNVPLKKLRSIGMTN